MDEERGAMFTEERQSAIEKCLRENGKVKVKELSEIFQVTEDCIRKDLKILENAGKLKRTYGGAILSQDYPLKRDVVDRRQFNLDKKRTIAAKAFKLIKDNETIFLGSGEQYDRYPADPCHKSVYYCNRYRGNNVPDSKRIYGSCNDRSD